MVKAQSFFVFGILTLVAGIACTRSPERVDAGASQLRVAAPAGTAGKDASGGAFLTLFGQSYLAKTGMRAPLGVGVAALVTYKLDLKKKLLRGNGGATPADLRLVDVARVTTGAASGWPSADMGRAVSAAMSAYTQRTGSQPSSQAVSGFVDAYLASPRGQAMTQANADFLRDNPGASSAAVSAYSETYNNTYAAELRRMSTDSSQTPEMRQAASDLYRQQAADNAQAFVVARAAGEQSGRADTPPAAGPTAQSDTLADVPVTDMLEAEPDQGEAADSFDPAWDSPENSEPALDP